jgi:hypothetical protein
LEELAWIMALGFWVSHPLVSFPSQEQVLLSYLSHSFIHWAGGLWIFVLRTWFDLLCDSYVGYWAHMCRQSNKSLWAPKKCRVHPICG